MAPADALQRATERVVWGEAPAREQLGTHALWGLSPTQNLLAPPPASVRASPAEDVPPIGVLLVAPGDVRHVLRTLALRRFSDTLQHRGLEFSIHEATVEQHARHLVLLRIAFDWELPLRQRAAAWLEVFGNALVQERTERYVARLGAELRDLACAANSDADDDDGRGSSRGRPDAAAAASSTCTVLGDALDLSRLKFRERDGLADALAAWRIAEEHQAPPQGIVRPPPAPRGDANEDREVFPIGELWDRRVRAMLGSRYDHRDGAYDWDYRALERAGAGLVHVKQYRRWRDAGVAFEFGDRTYGRPNRTLATFRQGFLRRGKDRGAKREVKGYWGDCVVGPHVAVGVDLLAADDGPDDERASLVRVVDKGSPGTERFRHNATVVAVYNVLADLWPLETGTRYTMRAPDDPHSGLGPTDAGPLGASGGSHHDQPAAKDAWHHQALTRARAIVEAFDGVALVPLCGDLGVSLRGLRKAGKRIDCAYLGFSAAHHLDAPDLRAVLHPGATLVVELAKYLIVLSLDQRRLFAEKVHAMGCAAGYRPLYDVAPATARDDPTVAALLGDWATTPKDLDAAFLRFAVPSP